MTGSGLVAVRACVKVPFLSMFEQFEVICI